MVQIANEMPKRVSASERAMEREANGGSEDKEKGYDLKHRVVHVENVSVTEKET